MNTIKYLYVDTISELDTFFVFRLSMIMFKSNSY